jgi:hypothetical protein
MSVPVLIRPLNARPDHPLAEASPRPSTGGSQRGPLPVARDQSKSGPSSLQAQAQTCPTIRANPYPEVTDLICRLPLSTLFYQLEAVHLGDLLRL